MLIHASGIIAIIKDMFLLYVKQSLSLQQTSKRKMLKAKLEKQK